MFSRRKEFDIVHVHSIRIAGTIALLTAKMLKKRTMQKIPDIGFAGISESFGELFGTLRRCVFRLAADVIVAMSEESVRVMKTTGYPESRILRITNGVDAGKTALVTTRNGQERVRIVFLGRLAAKKGILDLVIAWKTVAAKIGDQKAELKIYGRGEMESRIREAISGQGVSNSAALYGYADDVPAVLAEADILVLPSYEEGNSNAILEAMAASLPIISTRVGGTATLVGKDGAAFLHKPGDTKALAEILQRLIMDRDLRVETGERMRERILMHFSIEDIRNRYVLAYQQLLEGKREQMHECSDFPPDGDSL
jgi:glycosyltransferase involved in cell wall biosynthesis